ncbi:ClpXP protease specificity-enhancing factor SspB [Rickettsiales endosymbiont of Trichoplax sp. H2]|uniref:ClpXP protease specificity-enhancing factor SspB n=1 Tax=Rickettsiales endosymbiont of Trichoplax sp. H2 TaxID=2021221 RepID=UPI0012B41613|nr:ClpXP protease specificity-enhancing factor SspB [Rickettsiales endosymbiont of Trichoplax sp. H2]MSO14314.1 hypothetical protein [Rickettsiales endosymbiont of Trichoplax sp. H2]
MVDKKNSSINYTHLINESMYYIIKMALKEVEKNGFTGNNHFYINFSTDFEGVEMPKILKAQYPNEITIILQYDFKNLRIFEDHFEVSLSFNNKYSHLSIPYKAITCFADPSESFELEFKQEYTNDVSEHDRLLENNNLINLDKKDSKKENNDKRSNVISLIDYIRSKNLH